MTKTEIYIDENKEPVQDKSKAFGVVVTEYAPDGSVTLENFYILER